MYRHVVGNVFLAYFNIFLANLEFFCRVLVGEDRQTDDSREKIGLGLFVHF